MSGKNHDHFSNSPFKLAYIKSATQLQVAGFSTVPTPTPRQSRSPTKRGQSFPVFATFRPATGNRQQGSKQGALLSPNSEMTAAAVGRRLSREWGPEALDITRSSEAIGHLATTTAERKHARKKSDGGVVVKTPIRRARSHENRDAGKLLPDLPEPARLTAQPIVGGRDMSERTKKQLESELKAILTARAHHFELHPPW